MRVRRNEYYLVLASSTRHRRIWHNEEWFFSVVDVVAALTQSPTPRQYWGKIMQREFTTLSLSIPDMNGFSVTNLRYIRQWYLFYSQRLSIHQQAVGELTMASIGVSEYQLTQSLPEDLKSSLPSIEEIEKELAGKK